jgi:putative aldouronate transport system substrate-binding protein
VYHATGVVKYDEPAGANGLLAYLKEFPANPPVTGKGKPTSGGKVSIAYPIGTPFTAVGKNKMWQLLQGNLGATVDLRGTPGPDYQKKFQTNLAGGYLADWNVVRFDTPDLPNVLADVFQDLSQHLSGDAAVDYPNLAAIPSPSWQGAVFANKIYGIPYFQTVTGMALVARGDLVKKAGSPSDIKSGDDLRSFMQEISDPRHNVWAASAPLQFIDTIMEMMGGPNVWRVADGKFTHAIESPEMTEAIDAVTGMWKDELFHPDSFAQPDDRAWFVAGTTLLLSWNSYWESLATSVVTTTPDGLVSPILPIRWSGGGLAKKHLRSGCGYITAMKKTDDADRVKELLRIADYLCSAWGSEEYLETCYGVRDVDYTLDSSGPSRTSLGQSEYTQLPAAFQKPYPHYMSGHPDAARQAYDYEKTVLASAEPLATIGLFSSTDQNEGGQLTKIIQDGQSDIISGRKSPSSWSDVVDRWRKAGGDAVRQEYEQSYAALHG